MAMNEQYAAIEPTRAQIDAMEDPLLLEFGAPWCGFCKAAQPLLASAFEQQGKVRHIKVEDGRGRPLGRSFRVKLWPTLIFFKRGVEVERLVRPTDAQAIQAALEKIASDGSPTQA